MTENVISYGKQIPYDPFHNVESNKETTATKKQAHKYKEQISGCQKQGVKGRRKIFNNTKAHNITHTYN